MKHEGIEKHLHANGSGRKAGVAILIMLVKVDVKTKTVIRDKEGHHIVIKGKIQQEDTTIINTYTPNMGAPKYIKQLLTD